MAETFGHVCRTGWPKVGTHVMHSGEHRLTYYRCDACSEEWTRDEPGPNFELPVSSDEILEVRELLARSEFAFSEVVR